MTSHYSVCMLGERMGTGLAYLVRLEQDLPLLLVLTKDDQLKKPNEETIHSTCQTLSRKAKHCHNRTCSFLPHQERNYYATQIKCLGSTESLLIPCESIPGQFLYICYHLFFAFLYYFSGRRLEWRASICILLRKGSWR